MTRDRFVDAWAMHCPLSYEPKVPWRGRLIVAADGDEIVTPAHTDALWEHWGRPRRFDFAGGHVLQVFRTDYHDALAAFLVELGVVPPGR